ncbi:MAG: N-formylglutamate amidohydrolase [Verrucomicrobiae bacterium]|nr:N-formylglutamate amidohydrolase [Verrucomicrobiae bacterium]
MKPLLSTGLLAALLPLLATAAQTELIALQEGQLPVILSAPHGGKDDIPGAKPRTGEGLKKGSSGFSIVRDVDTDLLTTEISRALEAKTGKKPYFVIAKFHRKFADVNRPPRIGYEDATAAEAYNAYHDALARYCEAARKQFGWALVLDIHGQSTAPDTIFRGTQNGKTVRALVRRFGEKVHVGPQSFCGLLAAQGLKVVPTDASPETSGFTGGHVVQACGEREGVGAIQLDFGSNLRKKETLPTTAGKVADTIAQFLKLYAEQ